MGRNIGSLLRNRGGPNRKADVWNVFVQVFTHLIGILLFVAVVNFVRYSVVADRDRQELNECRFDQNNARIDSKYYEEMDGRKKALMELQRQKLLLSLHALMTKERDRIGLQWFPDGEHVVLRGLNIEDQKFRDFTDAISSFVDSQETGTLLYRQVLMDAEVKEVAGRYEVRRWDQQDTIAPSDVRSVEGFKEDRISDANRAFIQNALLDALQGIQWDAVEIQKQVVARIFDELDGEISADLSAKVKAAWNKMKGPAVDKEQKEAAVSAYLYVAAEEIRGRLHKQGLNFLKGSWGDFEPSD
jgi:hypothetical protein